MELIRYSGVTGNLVRTWRSSIRSIGSERDDSEDYIDSGRELLNAWEAQVESVIKKTGPCEGNKINLANIRGSLIVNLKDERLSAEQMEDRICIVLANAMINWCQIGQPHSPPCCPSSFQLAPELMVTILRSCLPKRRIPKSHNKDKQLLEVLKFSDWSIAKAVQFFCGDRAPNAEDEETNEDESEDEDE